MQEGAVNTITYRCTWSVPKLRTRSFLWSRLHGAAGAITTSPVSKTVKFVWDMKKGDGKKEINVFDSAKWWLLISPEKRFLEISALSSIPLQCWVSRTQKFNTYLLSTWVLFFLDTWDWGVFLPRYLNQNVSGLVVFHKKMSHIRDNLLFFPLDCYVRTMVASGSQVLMMWHQHLAQGWSQQPINQI